MLRLGNPKPIVARRFESKLPMWENTYIGFGGDKATLSFPTNSEVGSFPQKRKFGYKGLD